MVVFAAVMIPGVRFGIMGVTYAYSAWTVVAGLLNLYLVGRCIQSSAWQILVSVAPIAAMAGVMGGLVHAVDVGPAHAWPFALRLITGFSLGVTAFAALCIATRNEAVAELARLLSSRLKPDAIPGWMRLRALMNR
jgi:hypothetical protein